MDFSQLFVVPSLIVGAGLGFFLSILLEKFFFQNPLKSERSDADLMRMAKLEADLAAARADSDKLVELHAYSRKLEAKLQELQSGSVTGDEEQALRVKVLEEQLSSKAALESKMAVLNQENDDLKKLVEQLRAKAEVFDSVVRADEIQELASNQMDAPRLMVQPVPATPAEEISHQIPNHQISEPVVSLPKSEVIVETVAPSAFVPEVSANVVEDVPVAEPVIEDAPVVESIAPSEPLVETVDATPEPVLDDPVMTPVVEAVTQPVASHPVVEQPSIEEAIVGAQPAPVDPTPIAPISIEPTSAEPAKIAGRPPITAQAFMPPTNQPIVPPSRPVETVNSASVIAPEPMVTTVSEPIEQPVTIPTPVVQAPAMPSPAVETPQVSNQERVIYQEPVMSVEVSEKPAIKEVRDPILDLAAAFESEQLQKQQAVEPVTPVVLTSEPVATPVVPTLEVATAPEVVRPTVQPEVIPAIRLEVAPELGGNAPIQPPVAEPVTAAASAADWNQSVMKSPVIEVVENLNPIPSASLAEGTLATHAVEAPALRLENMVTPGFEREAKDPLEKIDGIGKIYQQKLYEAGIKTFAQLAAASPSRITEVIEQQNWQAIDVMKWRREAALFAAGEKH